MGEEDCVFCGIVAGAVEASCVYEDEDVLAFMDIQPVTHGHLLVIPKAHVADLGGLDAGVGGSVFRAAQLLTGALRSSELPCDGVNLLLADGEAAGQDVFHVHLHVIPRTDGDGFRVESAWRTRPRDLLDQDAAEVRRGVVVPRAEAGGIASRGR